MSLTKKEAMDGLAVKFAEKLETLLDCIDGDTKGAAAVLNVARQYLKDNNYDATGGEGSPLDRIGQKTTQFPFNPAEDSSTH